MGQLEDAERPARRADESPLQPYGKVAIGNQKHLGFAFAVSAAPMPN